VSQKNNPLAKVQYFRRHLTFLSKIFRRYRGVYKT
jgi:hypothetical protein